MCETPNLSVDKSVHDLMLAIRELWTIHNVDRLTAEHGVPQFSQLPEDQSFAARERLLSFRGVKTNGDLVVNVEGSLSEATVTLRFMTENNCGIQGVLVHFNHDLFNEGKRVDHGSVGELAKAIASMLQVTRLGFLSVVLHHCRLTADDTQVIVNSVLCNPWLAYLRFSASFTPPAIPVLCRLVTARSLQHLDFTKTFRNTGTGDIACSLLADALLSNPGGAVSHIGLSGNGIGDEGACHLARILASHDASIVNLP